MKILLRRRESGGGNDIATSYLTFIPSADSTFTFKKKGTGNDIEYSIDGGVWTTLASEVASPTVSAGHEIRWRAELTPETEVGIGKFYSSDTFEVYGNPLSLLYGKHFRHKTTFPSGSYNFYQLFYGCTNLTSAENVKFVVENLTGFINCYQEMFYGCTSLVTPPPTLAATSLSTSCYESMFEKCSAMTTVPVLPAMTIPNRGYLAMFRDCTSLTTAPDLPATSISQLCYRNMFLNCTALTTAPSELPAMTVFTYCYHSMFNGCKSLLNAPVLPALTLAEQSYGNMLFNCKKVNYITMLATDITATNCLQNWVSNVAASGTFVKNANMSSLPSGASGIPNDWTVIDAA